MPNSGSDSNVCTLDFCLLFGLFTLKPVFWAVKPVTLHPGGKSSAYACSSTVTVFSVSHWQIHDWTFMHKQQKALDDKKKI